MRHKTSSPTSIRLTKDCERMCLLLMDRYGVNRTRAVDIAIRKWASLEGITKADIEAVVLPEEVND